MKKLLFISISIILLSGCSDERYEIISDGENFVRYDKKTGATWHAYGSSHNDWKWLPISEGTIKPDKTTALDFFK